MAGKYAGKSLALGGGGRFARLKAKLQGKVENPAGLSAVIGRKKFGAKKFARMGAIGRHRAALARGGK